MISKETVLEEGKSLNLIKKLLQKISRKIFPTGKISLRFQRRN